MDMSDTQVMASIIKLQENLSNALREINETIKDAARVSKPVFETDEEERGRVMTFLFKLQKSGITNMMNSDAFIQKRFGLTPARSEAYMFEYLENYEELYAKYSDTVQVQSQVQVVTAPVEVKKRKGPKPYSEMTPEEIAEVKARKAKKLLDSTVGSALPSDMPSALPSASPSALPSALPLALPSGKRVIKIKKPEAPRSNAMLMWNSFLNTVKAEMELSGEAVKYEDVRKRALEMKDSDPDSYRLFSENWSPEV